MSPDTFYFHRLNVSPIWQLVLFKDEVRTITVDCSAYCGVKETTISSSNFVPESGNYVGVSGKSDTDDTLQANFTGAEEGMEYVTMSAVLANGETLVQRFQVMVLEPRTERFTTDYLT